MTPDKQKMPDKPNTNDNAERRTLYKNPKTGELEGMTKSEYESILKESHDNKVKTVSGETTPESEDTEEKSETTPKDKYETAKTERKKLMKFSKINQYLFNKDSRNRPRKFSKEIQRYILNLVDSIHDEMMRINTFIAQIRHQQVLVERYEDEYYNNRPITAKDEHGRTLQRRELYVEIINLKQSQHGHVSAIRQMLIQNLLSKVDDVFTFEDFDKYVTQVKKQVEDNLGFVLFPNKPQTIKPM